MREYTTVEVEGIVRTEMKSDLENLIREGARPMLEVALQVEVAECVKDPRKSERSTWTMGKMSLLLHPLPSQDDHRGDHDQ